MNLQSIIVTNCIGIAILIILLISSHLVRLRRQNSDRIFTSLILVTIGSCTVEPITFIIDGIDFPFAFAVDMILNSWLYVANIIVSFAWCIYVDLRLYNDEERIRKIYTALFAPSALGLIGIIFNFRYQFAFSIDENFVYHRESIGNLYYLITFINLFISIFVRYIHYKKFGKNRFFPIYMFLAPIFAGATAQFMVYGISLAWCSVSLGLVGIYMSLQNELSYIDPLTRLYNRNYLNHVINEINRRKMTAGGIMIDLDYFKSINDNFGHSAGDEALIDTARILRKAVPEKAVVIRYAGDEFVIILHTEKEEDIVDMAESLRKCVGDFNDSKSRKYSLSFSIGYSMRTGSDISTDDFLHEMDNNMYDEKKKKHSRNAA